MRRRIGALLDEALAAAIAAGELPAAAAGHRGAVDEPRDPSWGDLACDVPLVVAATLRTPATLVAAVLQRHLPDPRGWLASIEVGGPGYLNLRLAPTFWYDVLTAASAADGAYGHSAEGQGRRVDVPIAGVPVAELPAARWRTALVADASARMLGAVGWEVGRVPGRGSRYLPRPGPVALILGAGPPAGDVAVERLLEAVSPATARFLLLAHPLDRPVAIDVALARRERVENPAFYLRYAVARCRRVLERSGPPDGEVAAEPLTRASIETLRVLGRYPDVVEQAATAWEPHRLLAIAVELAAAFHRYYNRDRVLAEGRALTPVRFAMARGVCQVLEETLHLVGVTSPEDE